jgi:hypothetical protein
MQTWMARGWLPYLLAGLGWVTIGALLGMPRGLGLLFVGLACLAFGGYGARARKKAGSRRQD